MPLVPRCCGAVTPVEQNFSSAHQSLCATIAPMPQTSRRSFLQTSATLAGLSPLTNLMAQTNSRIAGGPLMAYVGTFSSPLRDTLPTQVDLPPGNGVTHCSTAKLPFILNLKRNFPPNS